MSFIEQISSGPLKFGETPPHNALSLSSRMMLKSETNIALRDVKVSIWSSNILSRPVINFIYFLFKSLISPKWEKHSIDNKIVFVNKKSLRTSESLSLLEQTLGVQSSHFDITKKTVKSLFKKQSAIFFETNKTHVLLQKSMDGRIEILKKIDEFGKGSYKTTSKVQDIATKKVFALSEIRAVDDIERHTRIVARTYEEIKITQEIRHLTDDPGIINIHTIVQKNGADKEHTTVAILSEACEGGILSYTKLKDKPPKQRLSLFLSVVRTMHNVHKAGFVHRDLKPDNIMLTSNQEIRIIDFGFACKLGDSVRKAGTPQYIPQEILISKNTTVSATTKHDVWSLGVILNELLTGESIYNAAASQLKKQTAEPIIAQKIVTMVESKSFGKKIKPKELQNLLKRMLEIDPEKRISLEEAIPILENILDSMK